MHLLWNIVLKKLMRILEKISKLLRLLLLSWPQLQTAVTEEHRTLIKWLNDKKHLFDEMLSLKRNMERLWDYWPLSTTYEVPFSLTAVGIESDCFHFTSVKVSCILFLVFYDFTHFSFLFCFDRFGSICCCLRSLFGIFGSHFTFSGGCLCLRGDFHLGLLLIGIHLCSCGISHSLVWVPC